MFTPPRSRHFDNLQTFEAEKNDLKAGITYQVQGILQVGSSDLVFGEMKKFTTPCTGKKINSIEMVFFLNLD